MKILSKLKNTAAFTVVEVIMVVALLGSLMAVAMPNVISSYVAVNLTELDDNARAIFMAAQNSMTAIVNAGELENLNDSLAGGTPITPTAVADPADARLASLRVINNRINTDEFARVLPAGSIDPKLANGMIWVEYDPASGAVYAVWYADEEPDGFDNLTWPRAKEERLKKNPLIGYYGGNEVTRPILKQVTPTVELTNKEELRLDITLDLSAYNGSGVGFDAGRLRVIMTVNGTEVELSGSNSDPHIAYAALGADTGVFTARVVLDKLENGKQFKDWAFTGVTPGDDITVTVSAVYEGTLNIDGQSTTLIIEPVTRKTNSLFDKVTANGDGGGACTAGIAYGRHLQNLDPKTSGVADNVTRAVQTQAINFMAASADWTGSGTPKPDYWNEVYGYSAKPFVCIENDHLKVYDGANQAISYLNIAQESSNGDGLFGRVYGAERKVIQNVTLINPHINTPNAASAGALIGYAENVKITNCHAYLEEGSDQYSSDKYYVAAGTAGGLVGQASDCVLTDCSASLVVKGGQYSGGLVGKATAAGGTVTITRCYAASHITSGSARSGGLVGALESGTLTVESCYAAGSIAGASNRAGLVAVSSGVGAAQINITNSYAAVSMPNGSYGAVYNPAGVSVNANGLYYVKKTDASYYAGAGTALSSEKMMDQAMGSGWSILATNYRAYPYHLTNDTKDLPYNYPYPMLVNQTGNGNAMTHYGDWLQEGKKEEDVLPGDLNGYIVYYEKYEDGTYGFYAVDMDKIENGAALNTLRAGDPNKRSYVVDDGYGVLRDTNEYHYSCYVKAIQQQCDVTKDLLDPIRVQGWWLYRLPHEVMNLRPGSDAFYQNNFCELLTITRKEDNTRSYYYFNSYLACEAFNMKRDVNSAIDTDKEKPSDFDYSGQAKKITKYSMKYYDIDGTLHTINTTDFIIRSARQLMGVAFLTSDEHSAARKSDFYQSSYRQMFHIDFSLYEYDASELRGKAASNPFVPMRLQNAVNYYDGHDFVIRNVYIGSGKYGGYRVAGLFGGLEGQGEVRNVRLVNATVNGSDAKYVGGLVGYASSNGNGNHNSNMLYNCGVYVEADGGKGAELLYDVYTVTGGEYAGGLAGYIGGECYVRNSFAAVKVSGQTAGGFVGYCNISQNKGIENCYAGGHTDAVTNNYPGVADNHKAANVYGSTQAGGFAGKIDMVKFWGVNFSTTSVYGGSAGLFSGNAANIQYGNNASEIYAVGQVNGGDNGILNTVGEQPKIASFTTHNYNRMLDGTTYPYKVADGQKTYYGDWVSIDGLEQLPGQVEGDTKDDSPGDSGDQGGGGDSGDSGGKGEPDDPGKNETPDTDTTPGQIILCAIYTNYYSRYFLVAQDWTEKPGDPFFLDPSGYSVANGGYSMALVYGPGVEIISVKENGNTLGAQNYSDINKLENLGNYNMNYYQVYYSNKVTVSYTYQGGSEVYRKTFNK